MADMMVKLYEIAVTVNCEESLKEKGIIIRRGLCPEKIIVSDWVRKKFGLHWAGECEVAFSRQPVSCFIALRDTEILGFACYETTMRNFFGPIGVDEKQRGTGIGKSLLLAYMNAIYMEGYAYAIVGGAGPEDFYAKTVGAVSIGGSWPGIFRGLLPWKEKLEKRTFNEDNR